MSSFLDKAKNFIADNVAHVPKPEADLDDVDLKDVSLESVTYNGKVSVNNPYDHSIPICQISYTLKSAGRVIASGVIADPGSLTGKGVTKLEVPVKVPHSVMVSLIKDVGADWDIDYEMVLGLTIDLPVIGDFTIPLSKKGEVKLPTFTDLF